MFQVILDGVNYHHQNMTYFIGTCLQIHDKRLYMRRTELFSLSENQLIIQLSSLVSCARKHSIYQLRWPAPPVLATDNTNCCAGGLILQSLIISMHNFADKWNTEWRVNLNMNKYEFLKHCCVAGIKVAHTQLIWTLQHSQIVFKILKFISRRCVKFWLCVIPSSLILLTVWASPHHPLKTNFNWILKTSPQLLSSFQPRGSENVEQRLM